MRFFIVTRGFGPGATPSSFIAMGLVHGRVVEVVRGAVRRGRRAKQSFEEFFEDLKVSVSLIAINGKDLVKPIINTMRTSYKDKPTPEIKVTPVKLAIKQPELNVRVTQVRNKNVKYRIDD